MENWQFDVFCGMMGIVIHVLFMMFGELYAIRRQEVTLDLISIRFFGIVALVVGVCLICRGLA